MRRVLVAAVVLLCAARLAHAQATKKVLVETEPAGAKVYLNGKEDGVACEPTPCSVDAPIGDTPIIIELAGYAPFVDSLTVARGGGKQKVHYELEAAGGTLDVTYTGPEATGKVDGKLVVKVPGKVPLDAGLHKVVVTVVATGKVIYDRPVEIELGKVYSLDVKPPDEVPGPPVGEGSDETPEGLGKGSGDVVGKGDKRPRSAPIVKVSGIFDVGFRKFSYTNGKKNSMNVFNVGDDTEKGQLMAGPVIEVFPTVLAGADVLPRLEIMGRFEFGFHDQVVSGDSIQGNTTTFWQAFEVSARNRWLIGDGAAIDGIVGYTRDRFEFSGDEQDIGFVPDADYQSILLGARGTLLMDGGRLQPYVELQSRIVFNGGDLQTRFDQASATGLHAAVGVMATRGKLMGRLEAQFTRFGWSFSNADTQNPEYVADGGVDQIEIVSFVVGYQY